MECVLLKKFMPTYIHSEIDCWFKKSTPVITHKEAKYSHLNRWAMVIKTALPLGHEMDF
jgi:hypothetical protein